MDTPDTPRPSGPLALFAVVSAHHHNTAWRDINPMYAKTLRLAITSRMHFEISDFAIISERYSAAHWLGDDASIEGWYALCIGRGHPSAAASFEAWLERPPFLVDGARVYVGRSFDWEGTNYRCTSITNDLIRAKRDGQPATLIEIPRGGFEAKIAADKAQALAERTAKKARERADPVALLPLSEHFRQEVASAAPRTHWGRAPIDYMAAWAQSYGTDYRRAWRECADAWWLSLWVEVLGLTPALAYKHSSDVDAIRKRHSWPKVEQAIFRFVRRQRDLPLRDSAAEKPLGGAR